MHRIIVAGCFLWCIVGAQVKFETDNKPVEAVSEKAEVRTNVTSNSGVKWPEDKKKEEENVATTRVEVKENVVDPHGVKFPGDDDKKNKEDVNDKSKDNTSGVIWPEDPKENNRDYGSTGTQACNEGQDCVPKFQCQNGQIKTDGGGILSDRVIQSNCVSSTHSCCGIPGWVPPATTVPPIVTCDYSQECVEEKLCNENGIIRTDGGNGLLADRINYDQKKCSLEVDGGGFHDSLYRSPLPQGVCCTPPATATTPSPWVVAPECGISSPTPRDFANVRIASPGHDEAYFGQFPWQAAVFFSNFTFQCGGTIIGDRWVITAAHCVHGSSGHELKVRVGEWQVNSFDEPLNYEDVDVKEVKIHENFNNDNFENNIAILELAKPLVWQYHINRICLPCDGQEFWGKRCIGSGWGKDTFTGNFANILKLVDLPIVDDTQCQNQLRKTRVGKYFILHDSFICAGGEDNKDACKGDGGGPLACQNPDGRYAVAGITNSGIDCGVKDVPGLYTDVVHLLPWIKHTIGGNDQSGCHQTPQPPQHYPEHHTTTQHYPGHHTTPQPGYPATTRQPHYGKVIGSGDTQAEVHQQADGKDYHFSWKKDGLKKFSHPQAVDYCKFLPGDWHIIAIENQSENDYVSNIIKTNNVENIWTDGVRTKNSQIWSWPHGGPFSALAWSSTGNYNQRQPDNHEASGEDCLAIQNNAYNDGVRWHDVQCSLPKHTICERVSRPGW